MTVTDSEMERSTRPRRSARASSPGRAFAAALPFILILVWSTAVRLTVYRFAEVDEFLFSVVAREWLHGGLPYVDVFDIKPPGIFLIYAVAQALFGASHATFKGLEIVAAASGALMLFIMLRPFGGGRLAIWSAALYPVYTLAFDGSAAINMLLQLPFVIAAFAAVVAATNDDATASRQRLIGALLAGLAIGSAGMIKQTAVFEATAAFIMLGVYGPAGTRFRMLALFVCGAVLPALGFSAYFLAVGHFREMFDAVIVLAAHRLDPAVLAGYGPAAAHYLTLPGAMENTIGQSVEVFFLWGGAFLTLLRIGLIRWSVPPRLLVTAATWLAFSLASAVSGRLLATYYLLATVPPLLILSGAFFCYGLRTIRAERGVTLAVLILLAGATLIAGEYRKLSDVDPWVHDGELVARTTDTIRGLGFTADDRLLVLTRGLPLYVTTGLRPPTAYFHGTHLMTAFPTPVENPLTVSLAANPRFIVLADPARPLLAGLPERQRQALDYLAAHYRVAAVEKGRKDSFTVYEFVR